MFYCISTSFLFINLGEGVWAGWQGKVEGGKSRSVGICLLSKQRAEVLFGWKDPLIQTPNQLYLPSPGKLQANKLILN